MSVEEDVDRVVALALETLAPNHVYMPWHGLIVVAGSSNFVGVGIGTASNNLPSLYQNPGALNDCLRLSCVLRKGSYKIEWGINAHSNRGIMQVLRGTTALDQFDYYTANPTFIKRSANFSVTQTSRQEFSFKVVGKNAASGGFFITGTDVKIVPV